MRTTALAPLMAGALALAAGPALADDVSYEAAGAQLTGYFAGSEDPKGLVLLVHDWDGTGEYERTRADMVSELGYDVFVLDMFGADTPVGTVDERRAATGALYQDRERMRTLIRAGLETAREQSDAEGLVIAGYCFGGAVALEMARSDMAGELDGVATFHGGLATPEGQGWSGEIPPLLIMHGGADESVTMEHVSTLVNELEAAGATYRVEIYSGAPHGFTEFASDATRRAPTRRAGRNSPTSWPSAWTDRHPGETRASRAGRPPFGWGGLLAPAGRAARDRITPPRVSARTAAWRAARKRARSGASPR